MTPAALAILMYSAQVLAVVAVAALGAPLLRRSTPRVRLAYWRTAGALCLVLPLIPIARPPASSYAVAFGPVVVAGRGALAPAAPLASSAGTLVVTIWAAVSALCLLRLCIGAWGLGRLRRSSEVADLDADAETMRREIAPRALARWSDRIRQPITFGVRRPVVLLPRQFGDLSAEARLAVLCHELLHAARRDWPWVVCEELVRALLWFHPAVWLVVDRVQLAREQVVDRMVVARTASKTAYMTALLTFADARPSQALAIAFLRRRHLRSRFHQLSKEPHMSARRVVAAATILATALGGTTLAAARAMPLDVQAAVRQVQGLPKLEIRLAERAPGRGLAEVTVAGSRERIYLHGDALATQVDVTSARAIDLGDSFGVSVFFSEPASERMRRETADHLGRPVAILLDGSVVSAPTLRSAVSGTAVITGITEAAARALAGRLSPARAPAGTAQGDHKVVLPVPVRQVKPYYTPAAKDAGIEGTVLLEAVVRKDGTVGDVTVVRALDPDLDQEAIKAMKQWTFKPGTVDGKAADVAVHVEMTFTLK